jgi:hypothetical protein
MYELAKIRTSQGKHEEAELLIRLAVDHGNPAAMSSLGFMALRKGDAPEAERLFKRAADRDDVMGLVELGKILSQRGERGAAEKLFWKVAGKGVALGNHCLGVVFAGAGRIQEAKAQYKIGMADGIIQSTVNLGELLWLEEQKPEAELLFRNASELGSAHAMGWLARALQERGEDAEADVWLQKAAASTGPALETS